MLRQLSTRSPWLPPNQYILPLLMDLFNFVCVSLVSTMLFCILKVVVEMIVQCKLLSIFFSLKKIAQVVSMFIHNYCRPEKFSSHFNLADWRFAQRPSKLKLSFFLQEHNNDVISPSGAHAQSQTEELELCACTTAHTHDNWPCPTSIDQLLRQNKFRQSKKYPVLAFNRQIFPPSKFPGLRYCIKFRRQQLTWDWIWNLTQANWCTSILKH